MPPSCPPSPACALRPWSGRTAAGDASPVLSPSCLALAARSGNATATATSPSLTELDGNLSPHPRLSCLLPKKKKNRILSQAALYGGNESGGKTAEVGVACEVARDGPLCHRGGTGAAMAARTTEARLGACRRQMRHLRPRPSLGPCRSEGVACPCRGRGSGCPASLQGGADGLILSSLVP